MIPVTVVDNFFTNPDAVREFALQQEFFSDKEGRWPGKRTKPLNEINPGLDDYIVRKIGSLFFTQPNNLVVFSAFQLVGEEFHSGWVHKDVPSLFSCITYLNKDNHTDSGTSIYKMVKVGYNEEEHSEKKIKAYLQNKNNLEAMEENNSYFQESITIRSEYNRLICFDARQNHAAQRFYGNTKETSRLTLVTFFNSVVTAERLGMQRMSEVVGI